MNPHREPRVYRSCGSTRRTASRARQGRTSPAGASRSECGPPARAHLQAFQALGQVRQRAARREPARPRVIDGPLKILLLVPSPSDLPAVVYVEGVSGYGGAVQVPMDPRRSELRLPGFTHPLAHARVAPVRLFAAQQAPSIGEPGAGDPHSTSSQQPASNSVTPGTGSQGSR